MIHTDQISPVATCTRREPEAPDLRSTHARKNLGRWGEDYVVNYLEERGWTILDRNWHVPRSHGIAGELDIVAFDPVRSAIIVVEVKTRRTYDSLGEMLTDRQISKISRVFGVWLSTHPHSTPNIGIDLCGVYCPEPDAVQLTHVRVW